MISLKWRCLRVPGAYGVDNTIYHPDTGKRVAQINGIRKANPAQYLPAKEPEMAEAVRVDLNRPMDEIRAQLSKYPVATRLVLSGKIIVARDIAHSKFQERLDRGEGLPDYTKNHIIYYAGPAKTPDGQASGSFGPTTAGRMDPYVPVFQAQGGSMIILAKGNRSQQVTDACKKFGGFYLGSPGGPAARLGRDFIKKVELWSMRSSAWRRFS